MMVAQRCEVISEFRRTIGCAAACHAAEPDHPTGGGHHRGGLLDGLLLAAAMR